MLNPYNLEMLTMNRGRELQEDLRRAALVRAARATQRAAAKLARGTMRLRRAIAPAPINFGVTASARSSCGNYIDGCRYMGIK